MSAAALRAALDRPALAAEDVLRPAQEEPAETGDAVRDIEAAVAVPAPTFVSSVADRGCRQGSRRGAT
jgi:ABC-type taurine transport system substrate-binding protein